MTPLDRDNVSMKVVLLNILSFFIQLDSTLIFYILLYSSSVLAQYANNIQLYSSCSPEEKRCLN